MQVWCLLLPLGIMPHPPQYRGLDLTVGQNVEIYIQHAVAVIIVCTLLLSVDEVANQLEYPFRFIPIDHIMKSYKDDGARYRVALRDSRVCA